MPKKERKARVQEPEILRAIRLEDGNTLEPGEEDQLIPAIEENLAAINAGLLAENRPESPQTVQKIMKRLAQKGYIVGFEGLVEDDEDDTQHPNSDLRANARHGKAAQVQKVVTGPVPKAMRVNRGKHKSSPVPDDPGDELEGETGVPGGGTGTDDEEIEGDV